MGDRDAALVRQGTVGEVVEGLRPRPVTWMAGAGALEQYRRLGGLRQCLAKAKAKARTVRVLGARPVDALVEDRTRMLVLPPIAPTTGIRATTRLARDYYVRVDSVSYSVDPRVIRRLVEVVAGLRTVTVTCAGVVVAEHRSWARRGTVTDPRHVGQAKQLRLDYWKRHHQQPPMSSFPDPVRSLGDHDDLYDVDFTGHDGTGSDVLA